MPPLLQYVSAISPIRWVIHMAGKMEQQVGWYSMTDGIILLEVFVFLCIVVSSGSMKKVFGKFRLTCKQED